MKARYINYYFVTTELLFRSFLAYVRNFLLYRQTKSDDFPASHQHYQVHSANKIHGCIHYDGTTVTSDVKVNTWKSLLIHFIHHFW